MVPLRRKLAQRRKEFREVELGVPPGMYDTPPFNQLEFAFVAIFKQKALWEEYHAKKTTNRRQNSGDGRKTPGSQG